ncbi:hypothetical protein ACMD2_12687 [Ananas comosus]|uniref:Uncharacterized protein n=1 Tax=Ananas comosus TaxID=4615 RepID=A0A199W7F1_ANACO|nr:hypothetical protein ACMD2_12687 [Ananas comosus]
MYLALPQSHTDLARGPSLHPIAICQVGLWAPPTQRCHVIGQPPRATEGSGPLAATQPNQGSGRCDVFVRIRPSSPPPPFYLFPHSIPRRSRFALRFPKHSPPSQSRFRSVVFWGIDSLS